VPIVKRIKNLDVDGKFFGVRLSIANIISAIGSQRSLQLSDTDHIKFSSALISNLY
jgi:hypothetical protein